MLKFFDAVSKAAVHIISLDILFSPKRSMTMFNFSYFINTPNVFTDAVLINVCRVFTSGFCHSDCFLVSLGVSRLSHRDLYTAALALAIALFAALLASLNKGFLCLLGRAGVPFLSPFFAVPDVSLSICFVIFMKFHWLLSILGQFSQSPA